MAIIKKSKNNKCWRGCEENGTLLHCWWECKLGQSLWRTVWWFLKKLKIELPYDPAIPLLGIYLEKTIIQKDTCTPMFTAALFTIVKTCKQPKCPSKAQWIKKILYVYTMEYYSVIIKNEIMPFVATWMDLEIIILSEISHTEEDKYHMIPLICGIKKNDTNEFIYKTETDSQTLKTNLWLPGGKVVGRDKLGVWD